MQPYSHLLWYYFVVYLLGDIFFFFMTVSLCPCIVPKTQQIYKKIITKTFNLISVKQDLKKVFFYSTTQVLQNPLILYSGIIIGVTSIVSLHLPFIDLLLSKKSLCSAFFIHKLINLQNDLMWYQPHFHFTNKEIEIWRS